MQNAKPAREQRDENDANSGAGSGLGVGPSRADAYTLMLADAELLKRLHEQGGAKSFVVLKNATLSDIVRLRAAGWIETLRDDAANRDKCCLSARGLSVLPAALQLISASPGARL